MMKNLKNTAVLGIALIALLSGCNKNSSSNTTQSTEQNKQSAKKPAGIFFGKDKSSSDQIFKALQTETLNKFVQLEFKDAETGKTMAYNLFIPKGYDKNKSYPLVLFIADSSTPGKETKTPLTQGYGGLIWATDESQAENPSFILVPQYTVATVNDNFETTEEVEMTIRLVNNLVNNYHIDNNRLYTTGQSMGGMMSMYFNITHPDFFAASIYVSCQWDVSKMKNFAKDKFFYIVAAGDEKAPKGMAALKRLLEGEGTKISSAEWSAKLSENEQTADVNKLLSAKNNINFITFTKGSVLPADGSGMEHMESFDYAYKLKAVRNWLFQQKK